MKKKLIPFLSKTLSSNAKTLLSLLYKVPPVFVFIVIFLFTIYWATFLPTLKFNYNIESFFSSEDPEVELYQGHRERFENENDFVLIGLKNEEGIFKKDFLTKLDSLTTALKEIKGITKIYSPTNIKEVVKSQFGTMDIPLIHPNQPDKYASDMKRIYESQLYTNSFFSNDTLAVSLLLKKEQEMSKPENDSLLHKIEHLIEVIKFKESHIAGRIKTQHFYVKKIEA